MDSEDWIKYMTEKVVVFVDTPREIRKQNKAQLKRSKEPWLIRWFGMTGMGMMIWIKGMKR